MLFFKYNYQFFYFLIHYYMFEQYNMGKKITRIIIFAIMVYFILEFIPKQVINREDVMKLTCSITLIFLMYDLYYPSVNIELKENELPYKKN